MKNVMITSIMILLSVSTGYALPKMKTTFYVVDAETGLPVTNAIIQKSFVLDHGWGGSKTRQETFTVDKNGFCTFSGETHIISGGGASVVSDGYYPDRGSSKFTGQNRILNRWEPWGPTIEVKLRKIKEPKSMIHKRIERKQVPEMDKPIGYDLEIGDWVTPYGKGGIADLIITASWYFQEKKKGSEGRYSVSFATETDGIQLYLFSENAQSNFKWPYEAPTNNYQSVMNKYISWPLNGGQRSTNYDDNNNYIFRVRSSKLEDGRIIGSYGIIQREIEVGPRGKISFEYWFNPVPNERSLEYSGENLLRKK